jgi:hypothetical protein
MKKPLLIALLLFSTVFIACAHGRKTTRKKASTKTAATAGLRGLTSVMMRRGACFGRCPEYTISINSNGLIEYNGTRNATPLGVYEKNVGAAKAQALLKKFMDYHADTCKSLYTSLIADMPGLSYTLVINGKTQVIGNAHFGPRFLVDLSDEVDELGKVDDSWKKIRDVPAGQ